MQQSAARVSTDDQDTAAQVAALKSAGCERIFREKASGGRWDRPQLVRLLDQLRAGDVVVVWKLDRLSRSLRDVLTIMECSRNTQSPLNTIPAAKKAGDGRQSPLWPPVASRYKSNASW